jgi:hypothetical protein
MRTKLRHIILGIVLLYSVESLFSQTNQAGRFYIPYLDEESQSNVIVAISGTGQLCPLEYTNTVSNTNLLTSIEQNLIQEIFVKYKNVTTNSGLPGAVLTDFYETNNIVRAMNRTFKIQNWVSNFQYTNSRDHEIVILGKGGLLAKFRNKSKDGYNVSFVSTGDGTMLRFSEEKDDSLNGLLVAFEDMHSQGKNWNFRRADFTTNSPLTEYRQYTNGMVFGKFLMWNPQNNDLMLEAEFTEPYDFEKHRLQPQLR